MSKYKIFEEKLEKLELLLKSDDFWEIEEEFEEIYESTEYHIWDLEDAAFKGDKVAGKLLIRFEKVEKKIKRLKKNNLDSMADMMCPDREDYDENEPMDEQWFDE